MIRTFGLRAALTFLVLIAIAPVFGVVVQASLSERSARVERAGASLRAIAELGAAHQERFIEGARQVLAAVAYAPPVYGEDVEACMAYMRRLQQQYANGYGTFGLLDTGGNLICRATRPTTPVNSSDRVFFRSAVSTGQFSVGEFTISRASGRPVLTFGLPVFHDEARTQLRGVAYLALDLTQAHEQLRRLQLAPDVTLMVSDSKGTILAAAGARALEVGSALPEEFLRRAVLGGRPQFDRDEGADGAEWLYAVQPTGETGAGKLFVAAMISRADLLAPSARQLRGQLAALALITLLAAACAWFFGDRVLARPVARTLQRIDALRREESPLDAPEAPTRIAELRELDSRFRELARGLVERQLLRDAALSELAAQKNLLESVLASMAEGVIVVNNSGRFDHINAAAHQVMPGLAEMNRTRSPRTTPAAEWGAYELDGITPLARGGPVFRALAGEDLDNFRYLLKGELSGGAPKIIQGHTRQLRSPQGERHGAVMVFADVTAAYRAEQALKDSELRYRTLFESNPHPMWVFDLETLRILTVNDSAVAHYGYSRDEFLRMTIKDIRPEEDIEPLVASMSEESQHHMPAMWRHRLKDGRVINVEISSHTLDYAGRAARMVLAHDITLRLQAQEALLQLNETLERRVEERTRELAMSNKELESFSYSVSHDLRAPLQVIDGFGKSLLARHADSLDEKGRHFLRRIRENTRQMGDLIEDLLSLARVTRTELRVEPVNLAPKAAQIVERLRLRFPEREVRVDIDDDIRCAGDARLLAVVLENLIENAWKFTARAAAAHIRVGRKAGASGENVIYVSDNGAGFDMAYADKLFNAFQRLHAATDFEGTGIGLATVHRVITRHGGRVWAESSPGEGATFLFTLKSGAIDETQQPDPPGGRQPRPPGAHPDDPGRKQRAQ
ncbi:MAG: PAS domain S-box protein [Pseudomonadota bacterium]